MLGVAIEDLELCMNNSHLPMRKRIVCFEPSSQKYSDSKNYIFTIMSWF